jgi:hypothetical protein
VGFAVGVAVGVAVAVSSTSLVAVLEDVLALSAFRLLSSLGATIPTPMNSAITAIGITHQEG